MIKAMTTVIMVKSTKFNNRSYDNNRIPEHKN